MRAPIVWVTQRALKRRRRIAGKMIESEIDLTTAERFGVLQFVLPARFDLNVNVADSMEQVREALRSARPGDYILPIGSPSVIGMVTALLAEQVSHFFMLYWDREAAEYLPVEMDFRKEVPREPS